MWDEHTAHVHLLVGQWLDDHGYNFETEVSLPGIDVVDFLAQHRDTGKRLIIECMPDCVGIKRTIERVLSYQRAVPDADVAIALPEAVISKRARSLCRRSSCQLIGVNTSALRRSHPPSHIQNDHPYEPSRQHEASTQSAGRLGAQQGQLRWRLKCSIDTGKVLERQVVDEEGNVMADLTEEEFTELFNAQPNVQMARKLLVEWLLEEYVRNRGQSSSAESTA